MADTFDGFERDLPLTLYVLALLEGVTLGPVFGGAIVTGLYWRWWVLCASLHGNTR